MKTIIAGSRDIIDYLVLGAAIQASGFEITEVVSGAARGVDNMGEQWAHFNNIPVKQFPADWNKYGAAAGPIRNAEMAKNAEALIAVWDGHSRGTKNMIDTAKKFGLKIYVHKLNVPK